MGRSIVLGDSAAGKTTLVRVLGEANVTYLCVDDYRRWEPRKIKDSRAS